MINSSGGMTGGDRLNWEFDAGPQTTMTVTTQACEKVYKSSGGTAETAVKVRVADGARFLWLPQETILFDRSSFARTIEADLDAASTALFVEAVVFGRRSMGETVQSATFLDRWRIRQNGCLIHAEDFRIGGQVADILEKPAVAGGHSAMATVLLVAPDPERHLASLRELIGEAGGVSACNGRLVARLTATDSYSLRKRLIPMMQVLNSGARPPKVWAL